MPRPTPSRQTTARRIVLTFLVFALVGVLLTARLFLLQLIDGPGLAREALAERLRTVTITPLRGEILDAEGNLLAEEIPAHEAFALTAQVVDPAAEASALAPVLHESAASLTALLRSRSWFVVISPPLSPEETRAVENLGLPGIGVEPVDYRVYPQGDLAANVLGFVSAGGQGLAGVEEEYNQELAGRPGSELLTVDAAGNPLPSFGATVHPAVPGDDLQLTINATLQAYAQAALQQAVRRDHLKDGRIIIMDPQTGAILALAEWPTFNPNDWQATPLADTADSAVQDTYPPGSTFKPLTLAAALTYGVLTPDSTFNDPGHITIDGVTLHDWNIVGFGHLDVAKAVAVSCDVCFMETGARLGTTRFYQGVLARFHLTAPTGVDLPGEASSIYTPAARARALSLAEMAFGQTLSVTPIGLTAALASIADGGVWHTPHVGEALILPDGHRVPLRFPSYRVLSPTVAAIVSHDMTEVTSKSYGTGLLARVPGYVIAGKTGTSELPVHGLYIGHYMGSFVGFTPVPDPRILILVQLNDPRGAYYGGTIAAPVFQKVLSEAVTTLGIPPDAPGGLTPPKGQVPPLVGDTLPQADGVAAHAGFNLAPSGDGPRVLSQYPAPGRTLGVGGTIAVDLGHVALGQVPSVLGLTVRAAAAAITHAGYRFAPFGVGIATRQLPKPGTKLTAGQTVRVYFQGQ
jgi:stage V sporulation protein D (sporulation-specific penicillin-binding protein)